LKEEARERGLLVMGPDCGTAILGGVPLAFANELPRGEVGIVSASGTGLQEVSCLIARGGSGISHGIGVGGRDLSEAVGGVMALMAIDALDRDPGTRRIVLISKPPSEEVAERVLDRVARSTKPFTICFLGLSEMNLPPNAKLVPTLTAAAEDALGTQFLSGESPLTQISGMKDSRRGWIRGLFSGGTLCAEAQFILRMGGEEVRSNAPVPGAKRLNGRRIEGHILLDLGADEYTVGRPHPMIDPSVRNEQLVQVLSKVEVRAVLLDVVLGYGAHQDPAGALVSALAEVKDRRAVVVASVCGTEEDPQVYSEQVEKLEGADVIVASSNAHAAELALQITQRD
ncbi:oxidoreductase, partial [Nitrospinota bacterium]